MYAIPLLAIVTGVVLQTVQAYGPKTESEKKETRYTECLLAMETADQNGDHQLSREEYQPFVHYLARELFGGELSPIVAEGDLPESMQELYEPLVKTSGVTKDDNNKVHHIDIFGANLENLNSVQDDRIKALHAVCEDVMHALAKLGPQTEAPLLVVTHPEHHPLDFGYGLEEEEEEEKDWDMDDAQMISIHTSFLVSNFKSLAPKDVDLTPDGVLWKAMADFVIQALEDDPNAPIVVGDDYDDDMYDDDSQYDDDDYGVNREDDAVALDTPGDDDAMARGNGTSTDAVDSTDGDEADSLDEVDSTDAEDEAADSTDAEDEAADSIDDEAEDETDTTDTDEGDSTDAEDEGEVADEESRHHSNDEEHHRRLHLGGNQHAVLEDLELSVNLVVLDLLCHDCHVLLKLTPLPHFRCCFTDTKSRKQNAPRSITTPVRLTIVCLT